MKRYSYFLAPLFPLLLLGMGIYFCTRQPTAKIDKMALDIAFNPRWELLCPPLPKQFFTQKFHYLKGGDQCWTYSSADNQHVIKFFKKRHITPKLWLNYLPSFLLQDYKEDKITKQLERRENTFSIYKMAYETLQQETAIHYVHLYKTEGMLPTITLVERNGKENLLELDRASFVVQEKAELLSARLKRTQTEAEREALHTQVLKIVRQRCQKGFRDLDLDMGHNYGFIDERAIQIDVGKMIVDPSMQQPEEIDTELARVDMIIKGILSKSFLN